MASRNMVEDLYLDFSDAALWKEGPDSKMKSLRDKEVYTEVLPPAGVHTIGTCPVFLAALDWSAVPGPFVSGRRSRTGIYGRAGPQC